ncbi:asparagine synthase B [Candidatus Woesearchaeota archaeon]|nr:asparagine synthase B [Candidatus Woesearchaeota archaeon]
MCGIIGISGFKQQQELYRERALKMAACIRHRGPDWSGIYSDDSMVLAHERLSIIDVEHGAQPLIDTKTGRVLCVNGEIYNHKELRGKLKWEHEWQTASDCEVILYLYDEYGPYCVEMLSGIFAFILYDKLKKEYFVARDHMGICPLYRGWDETGVMHISSEMKALDQYCPKIEEFPAGSYYYSTDRKIKRWYSPHWATTIPTEKVSLEKLREELEYAVKKQLMADVPYGVLISGGLDSSLIAAIACKMKEGKDPLHSFAVGLKDAPDLDYARKVAEFLGTRHHEILFTIQEGMDALKDVIYHLETFDVTTIRASTPMYLIARKIKAMGIKMVLSGEGSDEIFGGYLYFHMAPNAQELHEESVRKLFLLSKYDCLRANKATAAWGLETRVPFLDKEFMEYAMSIDPTDKLCPGKVIEKKILREAFAGYIPEEILRRQKEQFSDGVGYGWIDHLKKYTNEKVTDQMMNDAIIRFPAKTPLTKEEYYYREIFNALFHSPSAVETVPVGPSIACSTPTALRWSKEFQGKADPSGRAVNVHKMSKENI